MSGSFFADIGYASVNKFGEQLCGDHVELAETEAGDAVLALADGMGSGVKANILSTLTGKILATMLAGGMPVEDCVLTLADTLPVCQVRGVAYSTFTALSVSDGREVEILQYDNPHVILLRGGRYHPIPEKKNEIDGKTIYRTRLALREGDVFFAMSDGVEHAGVGQLMNFGWRRQDIIRFLESRFQANLNARELSRMLVDECNRLYGYRPGDDTTVAVLRVCARQQVNLVIGPPEHPEDDTRQMSEFFAQPGKHIVCGGKTASIAARFLQKPIDTRLEYIDAEIPPTARIEGVDLVTEGVITMGRVLEYARDCLEDGEDTDVWREGEDGASQIARLLFDEATEVVLFVGRAVNPAHQNPDLPISFNIKMHMMEELSACLVKMGKRVRTVYF